MINNIVVLIPIDCFGGPLYNMEEGNKSVGISTIAAVTNGYNIHVNVFMMAGLESSCSLALIYLLLVEKITKFLECYQIQIA